MFEKLHEACKTWHAYKLILPIRAISKLEEEENDIPKKEG